MTCTRHGGNDATMTFCKYCDAETVERHSHPTPPGDGLLIGDPKAHALTLAAMIRKASEGYEVGNVRAHREQWAIVIAALENFARSESGRIEELAKAAGWVGLADPFRYLQKYIARTEKLSGRKEGLTNG